MKDQQIKLYYKNTTAEMIGTEHGINAEDLKIIAKKTVEAVGKVNDDRDAKKIDEFSYQFLSRKPLTDIAELEDEIDDLKDKKGLKNTAEDLAEEQRSVFTEELRREGNY